MMRTTSCASRGRQKGASLIFALIALVSMMLAAIALVRSVDSGSRILGNIGFQQDATASAERATREATTWLTASGRDLTVNSATATDGYYANAPINLDVTGQLGSPATRTLVNWGNNNCGGSSAACLTPHNSGAVSTGNTAQYVIFRLCQSTGALSTSNCAQPLTSSGGDPSSNGACSAGGGKCAAEGAATGQYFRIVVRVSGSRDTTSFTETIVQY